MDPRSIKANCTLKAVWICDKCGSEYEQAVCNRIKRPGCPYCNNRKVKVGYNDLATMNPTLATEWNYEKNGELTPQMVTIVSSKKVWWI
ncbi:zinc-ribbon domain-containing protein, partial [Klebsiella pneumoniae]|uniref:zinc-ribbon domain-containing protein n=1 Tax=Klebsiella pneumoniae TaxID=573 RepID=UPI0034D97D04